MDFASLMKSEIAKKSAILETKQLVSEKRRFFKRSDMHKKGYDGKLAHVASSEYKRKRDIGNVVVDVDEDIIPKKVNVADSDIAKTLLEADSTISQTLGRSQREVPLNERIVRRRLRERREPIKLFGESEHETYVRLRKIELESLGMNRYADGFLRNDFRFSKARQKQEEIEALLAREYAKGQNLPENKKLALSHNRSSKEFRYDLKLGSIEPEVVRLLPKTDETHAEALARGLKDMVRIAAYLKEGTRQIEMDVMLWIFRYWQILWGKELNEMRSFEQKKSMKGKKQTEVWKQSEEWLEPLYEMLRTHNLPADIAVHLADMLKLALIERDYVRANNAYLELAIGDSPWPLGITMTQIHVRPGHEKIKAKNVSHIFNDETQRRYIQSAKRLMTFAQRTWPTDPSKCVEFKGSMPDYDLLAASSVDKAGASLS